MKSLKDSKKLFEEEAGQLLDTGKNTHPHVLLAQATYLDELLHSTQQDL